MRVTINGEHREVADGLSVEELVKQFHFRPKQVAIEVNCDLVPRRQYPDTPLREGDEIEIVTLVGGG